MSEEASRFRDFVAVVLLILPIVDWSAVYLLWKALRGAGNRAGVALKERFTVAVFLAITVSLNALIGLVVLLDITLPSGFALAILATSLIMVSAPNLYWLYLYSWDKFKK